MQCDNGVVKVYKVTIGFYAERRWRSYMDSDRTDNITRVVEDMIGCGGFGVYGYGVSSLKRIKFGVVGGGTPPKEMCS